MWPPLATSPAPTRPQPHRSPRLRIEGSRQRSCQALSVIGRTGQPLRRQPQPEGRAGPQARSGVEAAGRPRSHYITVERASAAPWGREVAEIVMDVARASAPRLGRRGGRSAPAGALGIAKGNALGSGQGGAWRSRRRGAAQARGNCAIVRNDGFRTRHPAARGEVQAAPGASVGWAQPNRPVYAPLSTTWLGTPPGPPGRSPPIGPPGVGQSLTAGVGWV